MNDYEQKKIRPAKSQMHIRSPNATKRRIKTATIRTKKPLPIVMVQNSQHSSVKPSSIKRSS